nr:hypothetical protein [Tanacetum cinerariifolium]
KELDKEEFQETGSMDAFRVLKRQFQHLIHSRFSLDDDDGQITSKLQAASQGMMQMLITQISNPYMTKSQWLGYNCLLNGTNDQQHAEQPEFNNEGGVDQDAEQCHDKRPLLPSLTDNKTS